MVSASAGLTSHTLKCLYCLMLLLISLLHLLRGNAPAFVLKKSPPHRFEELFAS